MRTLFAAVCALTFLGCGVGVDDSLEPALPATSVAKSEAAVSKGEIEPDSELTMRLEIVGTKDGLIFKLVQDPVEDRFRYPVDVSNPPPAIPAPRCPACR